VDEGNVPLANSPTKPVALATQTWLAGYFLTITARAEHVQYLTVSLA